MKKQAHITIKNGETTDRIVCHFQLVQCVRRHGRTTWMARKTIKGKRKLFSSDEVDHQSAWRDLNQQCHDSISGKKRDDLQGVISALRDCDSDLPLQYVNFRD